MTACPIRYQRQVSDRKGKIFYTSITSLSHISKWRGEHVWIIRMVVMLLEQQVHRCLWDRHQTY